MLASLLLLVSSSVHFSTTSCLPVVLLPVICLFELPLFSATPPTSPHIPPTHTLTRPSPAFFPAFLSVKHVAFPLRGLGTPGPAAVDVGPRRRCCRTPCQRMTNESAQRGTFAALSRFSQVTVGSAARQGEEAVPTKKNIFFPRGSEDKRRRRHGRDARAGKARGSLLPPINVITALPQVSLTGRGKKNSFSNPCCFLYVGAILKDLHAKKMRKSASGRSSGGVDVGGCFPEMKVLFSRQTEASECLTSLKMTAMWKEL